MSNMPNNSEQTEMLLLLHNIDDRLKEILEILRLSNHEALEAAQRKVLSGSQLRQKICDLSDGSKSVSEISKELNKSVQQISNNIALLQKAGLIKEIRKGKEKYYLRTR
jgi:DNA-binding transcriptional ArsR family regulator